MITYVLFLSKFEITWLLSNEGKYKYNFLILSI